MKARRERDYIVKEKKLYVIVVMEANQNLVEEITVDAIAGKMENVIGLFQAKT
jgi:hypothetical protein